MMASTETGRGAASGVEFCHVRSKGACGLAYHRKLLSDQASPPRIDKDPCLVVAFVVLVAFGGGVSPFGALRGRN